MTSVANRMISRIDYGQQLASALHVGRAPSFVSRRAIDKGDIAVSEIRRDLAEHQYSSPVPHDEAFLITLNIREWAKRILWIDDKPVRAQPLAAGTTNIFDLRRKYIGYGVSPFHMLSFYLSHAVLDAVADLDESPRVGHLRHDPCGGIDDVVVRELGFSLRPAFERPDEANLLFVDHVTSAIAAHVVHRYGAADGRRRTFESELTLRQLARAKEVIRADLNGNITLTRLAGECGLSLTGFRKAFASTVGMPPHRWLLERRIERAMDLVRHSALALSDVALDCGFQSERHMTRAFVQLVGLTPEAWRATVVS